MKTNFHIILPDRLFESEQFELIQRGVFIQFLSSLSWAEYFTTLTLWVKQFVT